jgi:dTMP kinase
MQKGKFIVLEGIDACGKDTQQELLREHFPNFIFVNVLDSKKSWTRKLREVMFASEYKWPTMSEILMFYADKHEMMKDIGEAIESGKNVMVNRWELSQYAYQIYGKQREDLREITDILTKNLEQKHKPDLYIYFDISISESQKRIAIRNGADYTKQDYFESQKKDFFERVIVGYKTEIQKWPNVIINAEQTKEKVFEDVLKAVKEIL